MRRFDVITFDCYGTLIDWETGISRQFPDVPRAALLRAYGEEEVAVEAGPYRPYREVLAEVARRLGERFGAAAPDLAASLPSWQPFPDTVAALRRLAAAGHALGILSNIDDDLFARTRTLLEVDFDVVVTAQQVRSYKPGHAHFLRARELTAGRRWLHAGQSYLHDMVPARALGIDHAWVNRAAQMPFGGGTVDLEVRTMAELADALA